MKRLRLLATPMVTCAGALLAAGPDSYPTWARSVLIGALLVGAALGIPAVPPVTIAAAKRDLPEAASAIEEAASGPVDG